MTKQTLYQFSANDRRGLQQFIQRVEQFMRPRPGRSLTRTSFESIEYLVKITGRGETPGSFTFQEVRFDLDAGEYVTKPNGITEETAGHAYDASGLSTIPLGVVVTIRPDYARLGTGAALYTFDAPAKYIWAKITGAAVLDDNRWKYAWSEQAIVSGAFTTPENALTGTTDSKHALNTLEANNAATGIQGNGIDVDNIPGGFSFLPASTGSPVVQLFEVLDEGSNAFLFTLANPVDGECE